MSTMAVDMTGKMIYQYTQRRMIKRHERVKVEERRRRVSPVFDGLLEEMRH
jgi:hypothetical protein